MRCLDCTKLDMKSYPKHTNTGFAKCKLELVGSFVSMTKERTCQTFDKAPTETIIKRETWALGAGLIKAKT